MKIRKIISIIAIAALMATLFVGCAGGGNNGGNAAPSYTVGIGQFGDHPSLDNCRIGFLEGLAEEGIVEGENLTVKYQSAQFDSGTTNLVAESFVSDNVDLICAIATPMAQACFNAAEGSDIPVIFTAVTDPEAAMLTEGNVTGTSDLLPVEQQLIMIRDLMPDATRIGILYTTSETNSVSAIEKYKELAPKYGFEIVESGVSAAADIPLAADNLVGKVDCLSNLTDNTVVGSLAVVLEKATNAGIPVFGSEVEQVKNGCAAAEGIEYVSLGRQTGKMAAKVLKGEATADQIPFEAIEESFLYINPDVMAQFGLSFSTSDMEARAQDITVLDSTAAE